MGSWRVIGLTVVGYGDKRSAEFFQAGWDPCLRAIAASTGDMLLAEDQVAEAFAGVGVLTEGQQPSGPEGVGCLRAALEAGASDSRLRANSH